jgi:aryl-alcohol dehydrogenase-like predicted oxidoreductase
MTTAAALGRRRFTSRTDQTIDFVELGFGTAPLGNLYRALTEAAAQATIARAWDLGCRTIDTAPLYGLGLSETRLNHFLRGRPRDEYVLSTKVGRVLQVCPPESRTGIGKFFDTPSRREIYDYSYDGAMRSWSGSASTVSTSCSATTSTSSPMVPRRRPTGASPSSWPAATGRSTNSGRRA